MLIYHDADEWVPHSEHHTCPFHRDHPGEAYAGCTCSVSLSYRRATPEEKARRRRERLEKQRDRLRRELAEVEVALTR